MELRQLQYFVAVADELHFGRAAERLHISQPPLSVQIRKLEHELGVQLFERTTRQVTLTPAGEELHGRLRRALADLDSCFTDLQEYIHGYRGHLTVGFVSSANYTLLAGTTALFRTRRPNVHLKLQPATSGEQLKMIEQGELDVGIIRDIVRRSPVSLTPVLEERLVACLPKTHPLANRTSVTPDEINAVPQISYPRHLMPGYVARVSAALDTADTPPTVVQEVIHQETALGFVAAGEGTAILPESIIQLLPSSLIAVPVQTSFTSQLLTATTIEHPQTPVEHVFIECVLEAADSYRAELHKMRAARRYTSDG